MAELAQITARQQRENLSVLAGSAFIRGAHTSVYNVIWQPFVLSLGASMPTLGLLSSLGGMNGIITTGVQPLGGWLADRLGRRPFVLGASIATIFSYLLFALAGWLNLWMLLAVGVLFYGCAALAFPARNSLTAESVRSDRHGTAFSLMSVASIVPGVLAPLAGGWLADRMGMVSVFPIAIALELIAFALAWRYLRETRLFSAKVSWKQAGAVLARSVIPPKGLAGFFAACAGDSFAWGIGWGLLYGMISDRFHFSAEQLGLMSSVMSLTWAVSQMPIGRYIDKRNLKGTMIFSEAIGIPLMLIWITQTSIEVFILSQILFAWTAATWVPVVNTYLARRVGADDLAEAFGRLNMFRGLVAFPAPAIGGILYAWGGMSLPLIANLIGIFVVMGILAIFVHEPERA